MESPWGERDWFYYMDYNEVPLCILQLDPADRAVIRIADERDAVQKKTFTKWVNKHLVKAGRKILDLYEDLRDGHNLISLLEVLAHDILPRERGHMRFHKIQNVQIALDFLRMKGIKLVNIRSDEIVDGNPKLTLGLIWTIILHFQISDVVVPGQEDITAKDALLLWSRRTTEGYPGVKIRDFSSSWRDGKAFLSILHRNRPDLVDIRHMRQNSNKQNLESAFSIAEREFGVTRLLDADDVDVPNPDEKSILTYVSSLYDVFPVVPSVEQSLRDNARQLKVEEYKELTSSLLTWIRENIKLMLSRNYPTTLTEIKALQSDFNRFRNEDVPPRLEMKNRAMRLFDEIQTLTSDPSPMSIEDEYLPHNIARMWNRFEAAMQERDMTLQAEVIRLERLHRLAEKAQRDIRYNEEIFTELRHRVDDTARNLDMMHAFEAKRNCDALELGLRNIEDALRGLFRDCQTLQDGNHQHAEHLHKRVSDLQAKVSSLRNQLYSQVMHPLLGRSADDRLGGGITRSRAEVVSESRLMDTDPAFKHVQGCLDWIEAKQRQLEEAKYGNDLPHVLEQLAVHGPEHEEVQLFHSRIDKCITDRANLSSESQKLYTQKLSKVEVAYSLLSKTSSRRFRCLESLSEFFQLATAELKWLSEREEVELSRDWGIVGLNLPELEEYHKTLVRQMESRESQFNSVQEKGGAMILDRHPSARTVETYMSTLQSQWSWLVHLSWCLETQVKYCSEHNAFFEEASLCEQWMKCHSEFLHNRFTSDNIPIDQAQILLAELQNLQDQIREYDRRVSSLVMKSRDIIPLKLRSQKVTSPIKVRTLCPCHQQDVSLQRGEECILVNNSVQTKWKVKTMAGLEADVPSACFLIPPPNQEAIDMASRLKLQHDQLSMLWKKQQRKVRMATIFAAIRQVKGWDLRKFLAMDPTQREAIWHALKEDGERLIAECGTSDRDMRKLSEELKQCEQIYHDLCEKAASRDGKRSINAGQATFQQVEALSRELTLADQQLSTLLHRPLPQNNLAVQDAFRSYRELQFKFDKHDKELRILQNEVKELSPRNSNIESKLNLVVQKSEQMKVISHIYVDRLKGCEVVITDLSEIKQLVTDFESSLAGHDNMTSDLSELKTVKNELVSLQESLQRHQPKLQQMKEDVESLRSLVERSRPGTTKHHDLQTVEKEVADLTKRWDQVCIQVVERLRSVNSCQDLLSLYHNGLHTEQTWASQMEKRISSQPSLNGDAADAKRQLEPIMAIYNSLGDRRYQIESVNRHGGQFIREAKISDMRLKQFKETVEVSGLSTVPYSKKFKRQDGADVVKDELDRLNRLYMEMVDWTNTRLKQIISIMSEHGEMQFQMVVDEEIPLLRTFRAELAKRSSMFVDEDMKNFITQQSEDSVQLQTTPAQMYMTTMQIRPESANSEFAEVTKIIHLHPKSMVTDNNTLLAEGGKHNPVDLSMTLKAMESSSTLVHQPSVVASSKSKEGDQPCKYYEQIVITIKKEDITPRGHILHVSAVLNPLTSKKVTLLEALKSGLIDTKTKTFIDPSTHQKFTLVQAAKKGYVDEMILKQLSSPCGTQDPQTCQELSLIDAIHKKLYDPITNTFTDSVTGEQVSIPEAVARDIISESCSHLLAGETVELTSITHTQAVFPNSEPLRGSKGLSLGKVLQKGLCSEITGRLSDPVSGTDMNLMEAVENEYVNPSYQEIKDPKTGNYITLTEAVASELVDPFKGTFRNLSTNQKLSLPIAMSQNQVKVATSLADVVSQGNMTEDEQVFDPVSGQVLTLTEAIRNGVISSDKKCILDPSSQDILSVKDAISKGIMTSSGLIVSPGNKTRYSILKAVEHGIVNLVQEDIQFSRSGIKDPRTNEIVTVYEGLKRGILTPQGTYVDSRTGREMTLQQASSSGLVDENLAKDLYKPTSMKDMAGRNISIAEALKLGIVDTETGCLKNTKTNEKMTMQTATSAGVISASDAMNILGLISPLMTVRITLAQTESTNPAEALTISEAVSQGYLNDKTGLFTDPKTGLVMPIEQAIQKGILKLSSEWPLPPLLSRSIDETESGRYALETFMTDTSDGTVRTIPTEPGTKKLESSHMSRKDSQYTLTTTTLAKPLLMHPLISETREVNLKSVFDPRSGRELSVDDALSRRLINLHTGQYTHPITGETMSINKACERGFIQAEQLHSKPEGGVAVKETKVFSIVGVLHPHTKKRLTISQAAADGILDQVKGVYNNPDFLGNPQPMKISEAIDKGFVLVENIGNFTVGPDSVLRETKSYILKSVKHPLTGKYMSIADAINEDIINESEGLYINPLTGETVPIHRAIEKGLVHAELVSVNTEVDKNINKITTMKTTTLSVTAVVDPRTGKLITVSKAVEEGILSQTKAIYINLLTGEHISLSDAIDKRLVLAESLEAQSDDPLEKAEISSIHITDEQDAHEASLMENVHSETVTMSITSVVDPRLMEAVSYEEAVESGILNIESGLYINPSTGETMNLAAALESGLIQGEITSAGRKDDIIRSSVSSATPTFALKDITSVIDPCSGREISFVKAIKEGIINPERGTYINPITHTELDLSKAKDLGYLVESKQSSPAQIVQSLEEEDLLQEQFSLPRLPRETNKPWSKVDMSLEKTVALDKFNGNDSLATEVLHYSTSVENDSSDPKEKGEIDRSKMDKQIGSGIFSKEALKMGLMVVAGAPIIAGKMVVDAVRQGSQTKGMALESNTVTALKREISPSKSTDHTTPKPSEPTVPAGYVDKPVTVTIDPGSTDSQSSLKVGRSTRVTFQPKHSAESTQELASLLDRLSPTRANFSGKTDFIKTPGTNQHTVDTALSKSQFASSNSESPNSQSSKIPVEDLSSRSARPVEDIKTKSFHETNVKDLEINWKAGTVIEKLSSERMTVTEAVQKGLIDSDLVDLASTSAHEFYTKQNIFIDWEQGKVIDSIINEPISIESALQKGLIDVPTATALASVAEQATEFNISMKSYGSISSVPHTLNTASTPGKYVTATTQINSPQSVLSHKEAITGNIKEAKESMVFDSLAVQEPSESLTDLANLDPKTRGHSHDIFKTDHDISEMDASSVPKKAPPVAPKPNSIVKQVVKEDETVGKALSEKPSSDKNKLFAENLNQTRVSTEDQQHLSFTSSRFSDTQDAGPTKAMDDRDIYFDPETGKQMSFEEAIELDKTDDQFKLHNLKSGQVFPLKEGLGEGTIDPTTGKTVDQSVRTTALRDAAKFGALVVIGAPIAAAMAVKESLSSFRDGTRKTNSEFDEASRTLKVVNPGSQVIEKNERDVENISVKTEPGLSEQKKHISITRVFDAEQGETVGLKEAMKRGLVDENCTVYKDSVTGTQMVIENAMKEGLVAGSIQTISKAQITDTSKKPSGSYKITGVLDTTTGREIGVDEAINKGLLSPSGKYTDFLSGNTISLDEAMKRGLVVSETVDKSSQPTSFATSFADRQREVEFLTFHDAMRSGLIDPSAGTFSDEASQKEYSVDEAVRTGLIVASDGRPFDYKRISDKGITYSFKTALQTGIIDAETCLFYDSLTGDSISIEAALENGYISPIAGTYGGRAVGQSVVLLKNGVAASAASSLEEILDSKTGEKLSLSEAERRGLVSVVRNDTKLTLSEAMQSGLIDSDSGLFHDPVSGNIIPIDQAVMCGCISMESREGNVLDRTDVNGYHSTTCEESMSIAAAISQGYLDPVTTTFTDPESEETLSVSKAVRRGLLKPLQTVGESEMHTLTQFDNWKKDTDKIQKSSHGTSSLSEDSFQSDHGFASGLTQSEKFSRESSTTQRSSALDSSQREDSGDESTYGITSLHTSPADSPISITQDRTSRPVTPGRMADSYDKLVEDIVAELRRLQSFEMILKEDTQMGAEAQKVQSQLEAHKAVHEEILSHQQPILSLVYQAEQLTELYQEELTPEQVTSLSGEAATLKKALEKVIKTSDRRLKHLKAAVDELNKLEGEMHNFNSWKSSAKDELLRQEECLQRFEDLKPIQDSQKELMTDIISHQADIRFMSMSAQKYMEEAKLHKLEVDSYRADRQRPSRSSLISMDCMAADVVKDQLKDISDDYSDLKHRCSAFGDCLTELSSKQRGFNDAAFKMLTWLADTEDELASIRQDSVTPDSDKLHGQLDRIKSLSSEVLSQSGLMDKVRKRGHDLTNSLSGLAADRHQVEKLVKDVKEIDERYASVNDTVVAQARQLQRTITQSQDIQGAITDIKAGLNSAQVALTSQQPINLELPIIAEQEKQFRLIAADVNGYGDSVESVRQATQEFIKAGDLHVARNLEQQLADIEDQFHKVHEACEGISRDFRDIGGKVDKFQDKVSTTHNWLQSKIEDVNSNDLNTVSCDTAKEQITNLVNDKRRKEEDIMKLNDIAKELREDPRTGSPACLNKAISQLEILSSQLDAAIHKREAEISHRDKQGNEFDSAKTLMLLWLAQMEARVDEFEPAAIEVDIVEKQIAELQPMLLEYEEQGFKVDEVNDLGNALEALTNSSDRPLSPIRRQARTRRIPGLTSPHLRSPSPTFPLSPNSMKTSMSSESSGVSSRKNSSDNLLLDDLSQTQQQLLDINQRYEILSERLADRHTELQNALASIRTFLQDMQDVFSWLDVKDNELILSGKGGIPANEKEAKKKLKEHEKFHRELLNKEGLVEDIRKKAQELLKSKPGVPGLDSLQSQLTDLDEKWHCLRAMSEERRKGLEDAVGHMRDFREYEDQLSKWIGQKEKLLDVLGPVAMEPLLLNSQMEQVKVLREEFLSKEPAVNQFINIGHAILDKCDASTTDSSNVSKRMDAINKSWNKLQGRLKDREKNIESVQGLSKEFAASTRELANWLGDFNDRIDSLPKVSSQLDKQQVQRQEMQNLQQDMEDKLPQLSKAKDLCQQLCDNTKDLSTKTDLRTKMTALDKDFSDTLKKLETRADAIEEASKAGEEFRDNCKQMLAWIQSASSTVTDPSALVGDADLLQKQVVDTKTLGQDMNLKEGEIRSLIEKGNKFIHESSPTAETRTIQETLTQLENEWKELKDCVKEREAKIKAAASCMQAFRQNMDKMCWWLETAEERLRKLIPESLDKASIAANLKELQSLQNELLKKSHDHNSFNKTADSLLDSVIDPNHELQDVVNDINKRWNALNTGLTDRAKSLEDFQNHLAEIEDNKSDVKHSLIRWEDKLAAHMDMGTVARDPKYIDKIKSMLEDISGIESQLDYIDSLVEGLNLSDDVDSTDLQNELKDLRIRHDHLQNDVKELLSNMEAGSSIVGQFQDMIKKVASELSDLSNDLSNMKPVSCNENELNAQLQEIKNFTSRLSDATEPLKDLREQAHDLQLAGFVSDPDGLNAQVETLLHQHTRLEDRTNQRQAEVETNLEKVHEMKNALISLQGKIEDAVIAVDSLMPIGSTADQIRDQQEELKKFSKTQVEALQKELDKLNFDIQALIKSAPSGISTGGLDENIEELLERWSELSEKVSQRERNLDKALLQSGKFKDALASLFTWLSETEEAMVNQKPPSPEFRVVKAQLQEQKLLQKMIDDRTSSVMSVKDMGNKLLSGVTGTEHDRMDSELRSLDKRWASVTSNADERMKTLEEMTDLAKHFQDIHESLAVWLDLTDKKFASLEPRSPNAGGIEKLIGELKHLQVDIAEHEGSVKELATLGKHLQDICKGEDIVIVQVKIDEIQKQFSDLKNKVDDSLEQMEEALPLAQHFQDAHKKFMDWVAKVEPEFRGKESAAEDTEEAVETLLEQLEAVQPYLDIINIEGSELAEVAPGDAGLHVEEIINKDNKKYEGIRQQIEKRADKMKMSRQRSLECINELDDLLDWFEKGQDKLISMSPIGAEPGTLQKQLAETKSFVEEIGDQKTRTRDAITSGKKLVRDCSKEDLNAIVEKIDQLKSVSDAVGSQAAERLSDLEQVLPLAKSFHETHENMQAWLDEVEPALAELEVTTVDANQVKKQQESIKALKRDVADYKPVIDRLNKTGSSLVQLVSPDAAQGVQTILDNDNKRVDDVRNGVRERSNSIDAAMQQSAEFTDKLEDMLETLTMAAETVLNAESISAHPSKIRQQIEENKTISEDMQMKSDALESVKEAADELIRQAGDATDPAVRDVHQKLQQLTRLYSDIENNCHDRNRALEDALEVSEKFWEDLNTLSGNIKELQYGLSNQEKPALVAEAIREQQEELEAFKEDLAATQADLEDLQETGDQLMALVGDTERPEVKKNLDDTEETLHNISNQVDKRSKDLDDVLLKAITFQEELQKLLVWLQTQENAFSEMEPIANDLETIKSQWNDIKIFKSIVDPMHVEIETLNQQAEEMTRDCTAEHAAVVREPVIEVTQRWDNLQESIRDRQKDIQAALLNLGQFDQAYNDFRSWIAGVDNTLEEIRPRFGDPKIVELELAKLKVIVNDIATHQDELDSLTGAADKIIAKEKAPEANKLKTKMEDLAKDWELLKKKASEKQALLEGARKEARDFSEEMQDILTKINELDGQMITSQPLGGLPETAKEQLNKFLDIYEEIEKLEPAVHDLHQKSEELAAKSNDDPAYSIRNNMDNLAQRWEHARNRAEDKKKKLEDAVGLAGNFHEELNKFITWLTDTEKTLNNLQPVSRLLDKITKQIEDHRVLQKDVSSHREVMFALDKMGTHLKYFSQKQDVVLIKNLLSSVQHRWEKIVSRSAERTRHLERGYKEAKQFYDSWKDLILWLTEAEQALNSETNVSNEPEKIRTQIAKHKEFQRRLGAKQPVYDSINRTGSTLQSKCPADDKPAIQALLTELKNKWNAVCGKSVDRQRKLEEGLLLSGQFNEGLEALLDWLAKAEPTLAEDSPVHGDLDTVNGFLEAHKAFQQELGARASTVQFVRKSAKDLIGKSCEDMSHIQSQLVELSTLWDRTCKLSVGKQDRLEQAHQLADDFHNKAQGLLDWLADAERQLRFKGPIPDEEPLIIQQIEDHKKFEESMLRQETLLRETLNIGQDIMKRCHPDAVSIMKHWLGVLRARWEELMGLSRLRQRRLTEALTNARLNSTLLEELLSWLNAAEVKLTDLDKEQIPKDIQIIQDLISQHQDFQNEMSSKQPSVDRLTKADKRKASTDSSGSHIPVFRGARNTARTKIPTIRIDRVGNAGRKTPDFFGRSTPEHFSGRRTPDISGRRTPDVSGRRTPDRSGRRTPDYLSGRHTPEPGFHNPRVGALFNKWRHVWLMAMYRQRKLQDALDYLNEVERLKNFDFDDWRKRYLRWMNHNKARIMDFFRRQDHDRDGRVTRQEFIDGILASKFPTSRLEMEAVADIFDKDGDGFINYKEFVSALRPDRDPKPETDSEKIMDEVRRQVSRCTCVKQFKIHKIGEGKYRFGDSQKLRLVRILRSTVMVRVGGGWIALDEFLVKNDPCRAKGRTNVELRENFILAEGVSQSMAGFVSKSPAGSSHSSGSSYSGRSASTASGPVTKIREKTMHHAPWRQKTKTSPDGEVHQIMSHTEPDGTKVVKHKVTQGLRSPRNVASPASRSSSRASTTSGSRPTSRTGSEAADDNQETFTTVQAETQKVGGRSDTTVTYQTHTVQTRNVTLPAVTTTKISRIPKISPTKKK